MSSPNAAVNSFRLASRALFNEHFRVAHEPYDNGGWSALERFILVEELLFEQMVSPTMRGALVRYGTPQGALRVSLSAGEFAPAMVNREVNSGYWDHPVEKLTCEAVLLFVRFFDWDQLAIHDGRYVEVVIHDWPSQPELKGKHALIESQYTAFGEV